MAAPATTLRRTDRSGMTSAVVMLATVATAMLSLTRIRAFGWTLSDLVFLIATVMALVIVMTHPKSFGSPRERKENPVISLAVWLFLTAATLTAFWSLDALGSFSIVLRLGWLTLVWFWLMRTVSVDMRAYRQLIGGFKATMILSGLAAVAGFAGLMTPLWAPVDDPARQNALLEHPNHLAGLLAIGMPFFISPLFPSTSPWAKPARFAVAGFLFFALSTTGSVTGLAAVVIGLISMPFIRLLLRPRRQWRRRSNPLAMVAWVVVIGVALILFMDTSASLLERLDLLGSEGSHVQRSAGSRWGQDSVVLNLLPSLLLTGIGLDQESVGTALQVHGIQESGIHNMYLGVLFSIGLIGMVSLVVMHVVTYARVRKLARQAHDRQEFEAVVTLLASLTALYFFLQFHMVLYERYVWVPLALAGALVRVIRTRVTTESDPAEPPRPPIRPPIRTRV